MKSSEIPDYAKVFRRLSLHGWNYYVKTSYGNIPISKSTYYEVKVKSRRYIIKQHNKKYILRNS